MRNLSTEKQFQQICHQHIASELFIYADTGYFQKLAKLFKHIISSASSDNNDVILIAFDIVSVV
jgi:hypothetical protein